MESVVASVWSFLESDNESVSSGGNASVLLESDFEDEELQASEEGELETPEESDKEDEGVQVEKVSFKEKGDGEDKILNLFFFFNLKAKIDLC